MTSKSVSDEYKFNNKHVLRQDELHAIIDLSKSGPIIGHDDCDFLIWNKEENVFFACLRKNDQNNLVISFFVPHFEEPEIDLNDVLDLCRKNYDSMADW